MAIDKKLIHFKTKENFMSANGVNGNPNTPTSGSEETGNAEYGQIKGTSIVFIQDSQQIGTHGQLYNCSEMVPITYGELKLLRDNGVLIPGMQYRITDYVTTTSQGGSQSTQHLFDIIVTADSENTLNEKARAIQHEGDTYFADSNLSAWELGYCLDNDTNRFNGADTTNGKGVIYRMIDEFANDCPYDFKNIQFKIPEDPTHPDYYYTFSTVIDGVVTDHSILQGCCSNNMIGGYFKGSIQIANGNIFLNESKDHACINNSFGKDCYENIFGSNCYHNSFGDRCCKNSMYHGCGGNSFGSDCCGNSFGLCCCNNSFGKACSNNSLGENAIYNYLGNMCNQNSFGNYCGLNYMRNNCSFNSLGNCCLSNLFEDDCTYNSFRVSGNTTASLKDDVCFNHFDYCCGYNIIWNSDTTGSGVLLKNINIRSVKGTYNSYNMININTLNQDYEIQVAKNSSGEIKTYCEADLIA